MLLTFMLALVLSLTGCHASEELNAPELEPATRVPGKPGKSAFHIKHDARRHALRTPGLSYGEGECMKRIWWSGFPMLLEMNEKLWLGTPGREVKIIHLQLLVAKKDESGQFVSTCPSSRIENVDGQILISTNQGIIVYVEDKLYPLYAGHGRVFKPLKHSLSHKANGTSWLGVGQM